MNAIDSDVFRTLTTRLLLRREKRGFHYLAENNWTHTFQGIVHHEYALAQYKTEKPDAYTIRLNAYTIRLIDGIFWNDPVTPTKGHRYFSGKHGFYEYATIDQQWTAMLYEFSDNYPGADYMLDWYRFNSPSDAVYVETWDWDSAVKDPEKCFTVSARPRDNAALGRTGDSAPSRSLPGSGRSPFVRK